MKTPTEQILETVRELKEAKRRAGNPTYTTQDASLFYEVMAANKMDQLCEALEICVEALEMYEHTTLCLDDGDNYVADDALTKAAKIMTKGKE